MPGQASLSFTRRLTDAFAMFIVAMISLVLLVYVAFGEAKRTYERFQIEKLVAQGQVVQTSIEQFVRPGLPIQQYVGFSQLTEPMVKSDPLIDAIGFFDASDARVFMAGDIAVPLLGNGSERQSLNDGIAELRQQGALLQVILPVRNRFEQVGSVVLSVPREKIARHVEDAFMPMVKIGLAASLAFALFVLLFAQKFSPNTRTRWIGGAFSMMFIGVAVLVVSTLISVYAQGAQARAKSLADSLGQRLDDLVIYNINLDHVTGIISLFGDYKRLNPEIRAAALIVDGKVRAHIDPKLRGAEWNRVSDDYEYTVDLTQPNNPRSVQIKVALPKDIVWRQVVRSVKNFAALFVASAFLAALFMGVARSLQRIAESSKEGAWTASDEKAVINLVKPVFFLAVFVEHLSYAFLPSLLQDSAVSAHLSGAFATAPFAAYYLMFALSLVPAGRLEQRFGAKGLMLFGLLLAGAGLALMALFSEFWLMVGARALSGVGQGVLFIGVQAYILANSAAERRTQAGGAIVFGFQAGMIGGMAIGSLLVSYLGASGVFALGAMLACMTALYGLMVLPTRVSGGEISASMHSAWHDMWRMLRDSSFARSIFLVGMPAKAVLTGVMLFAMPLLLAQQGYAKEDIGQITMIYAGAVILASHFASIRTDKTSNTESILFQGTTMTALGLFLIAGVSLISWSASPVTGTIMILTGVILVGFAHGCINAPIVTHIVQTKIAGDVGTTNAAAAYRLMERLGHIVGPLIVGQLFLYFGVSWIVLAWIGGAIFLMGSLFLSPAAHHEGEAEISRN